MPRKPPTRRLLEKVIPVSREELEATYIIHGQPYPDVMEYLLREAETRTYIDLSDPNNPTGIYIPRRPIHAHPPLSSIAQPLGLEINVRILIVDPTPPHYLGIPLYFVEEPRPTELTRRLYIFLRHKIGETGVTRPADIINVFRETLEGLGVDPDYALALGDVKAAIYYVYRDLAGYGPLEVPMTDELVEEVSWYRYDGPVAVVDKEIQSKMPNVEFVYTNIFIPPYVDDTLRRFLLTQAVRIAAARARTGLTTARPLAEARIPDPKGLGFHRYAAHLEMVGLSPALTIRKFPYRRMSITELIKYNTLSPLAAAYLIYQLLHRGFILIVGEMGSGKTTLLNALISSVPATRKVITIEDTPELSTPAFNWHALYVRRAPKESELEDVTFSKLVQHSLRHRGSVVTLGEVRGEEMSDLIQSAASGHGAVCTFHAHDPMSVLLRITSPPINAAPESLLLITSLVHISLTKTYAHGVPKSVRRVTRIFEIQDVKGRRVWQAVTFRWDPRTDTHYPVMSDAGLLELWNRSRVLKVIGESVYGDEAPRAAVDVLVLAKYLHWLVKREVYDVSKVLWYLTRFYLVMDKYSDRLWREKYRYVFAKAA